MTLSGNSEIQQVIGEALASRPYSHDQRAVTNVTAVITVEHDLRFLPRTLASVLRQSVLPSTIVIADCSGNTVQSVQTSFEIIPTVAEVYQEVPEPQRISVQLVRVTQAKSFADAVAKVLRTAQIDTSTKMLWLLHDDSRRPTTAASRLYSTRGATHPPPRCSAPNNSTGKAHTCMRSAPMPPHTA